jgi:hypothetical protein
MEKTYKYKYEKYKQKYLMAKCEKCTNCLDCKTSLVGGSICPGCQRTHHMCKNCTK